MANNDDAPLEILSLALAQSHLSINIKLGFSQAVYVCSDAPPKRLPQLDLASRQEAIRQHLNQRPWNLRFQFQQSYYNHNNGPLKAEWLQWQDTSIETLATRIPAREKRVRLCTSAFHIWAGSLEADTAQPDETGAQVSLGKRKRAVLSVQEIS